MLLACLHLEGLTREAAQLYKATLIRFADGYTAKLSKKGMKSDAVPNPANPWKGLKPQEHLLLLPPLINSQIKLGQISQIKQSESEKMFSFSIGIYVSPFVNPYPALKAVIILGKCAKTRPIYAHSRLTQCENFFEINWRIYNSPSLSVKPR